MIKFIYKVYIPYQFILGNKFYNTIYTNREFTIKDVKLTFHLQENGLEDECYVIAETYINDDENESVDIEDIADIKVGKLLQEFFDGLSKAFNNSAFFNIFDGYQITLKHEIRYKGMVQYNPRDQNKNFYIDDEVIDKAINFSTVKNIHIKKAFIFLKEGEYFIDTGRFESAIIQFAIMFEYLINYLLRKSEYINENGHFKNKYKNECERLYKEEYDLNEKPPFSYAKYKYGLRLIGKSMEEELVESIHCIYILRNKLAHGYNLNEAIKICDVKQGDENVTDYNMLEFMQSVSCNATDVYNFFSDIIER